MLTIRGLCSGYGRIRVLEQVDLDVEEGEIVTLIGANGAGKTTLLMTLCGKPQASAGSVRFQGEELLGLPTFRIIRQGIAHAPEGRHIFPRMTVLENLQIGAVTSPPEHFSGDLAMILELFPRLAERLRQRAGTLSGGEQQMLAIGRALMGRPKLLLLDEPSLGLAPIIVKQIFDIIRTINQSRGMTVLLVEQNAFHALKLAHRAYVMVQGRITLSGSGADLLADPAVRAAYLEGGGH
jgi:branched-chain amino acid transport system ATP-binding protein